MKIKTRNNKSNPDVIVLDLDGPLHILNADTFKEHIHGVLTANTLIALNMSKVIHLDSSGIGALIQAKKHTRDTGGNMVMYSVQEAVRSVLTMAGLKMFFNMLADEDEAAGYLVRHAGEATEEPIG